MGIFESFKKKVRGSGDEEKQKQGVAVPKSASQPYKIGDRIGGRYEIHRILGGEGKSGMGIVYVCYDHKFKIVFALKTFQDKYLFSKKIKDAFKKESLAWIHLEMHPYIALAAWVDELDYRMFVVCEYIAPDDEGRNTLTHYIKSPISLKQALIWSIQFCHGMEYAYSKGITPHRDIKPDNTMITRDGTVKITDFGLAGLWDKAEMAGELKGLLNEKNNEFTFLRVVEGRIVAGTPPWMAPEQFDGIADVRSDIYSFGLVLYQMVNRGELPFYPRKGDSWEIVHKRYPVPTIDSRLFSIIEKCLKKNREERYSRFDELRKGLERFYESEMDERPPSPPEPVGLDAVEHSNKGTSLYVLGLLDEAIEEYRTALRINPEYVMAHNNLGLALNNKGLFDDAIKEYKEALRIDPELADAHNGLGLALYNKGLFDDAIKEYKEALRINPKYAKARYNLGLAYYDKGLINEAIKEYREALKIDPKLVEAHINLGQALGNKGFHDEAIREWREALRIAPEFANVHCNIGKSFFYKGLHDEAIKEFKDAIRINPELADAHNSLGAVLQAKGLIDEAIKEFREVTRIDPDNARTYFNLGTAFVSKGLLDEAIKEFRNALEINPEYVSAHINLGGTLVNKGLTDEASMEFREALRINPESADAHYNLGVVLYDKGITNKAIKAFEKFIEYAPPQSADRVKEVKEFIKQLKGQ